MFIVRFFQNIRMRWKVLILVAAFVILAVAASLVGYFGLNSLEYAIDRNDTEFADVTVTVFAAEAAARHMHGAIAMMMAVDDPAHINKELADFDKAFERINGRAMHYAQHLINPRRQAMFNNIEATWRPLAEIYQKIVGMVRDGQRTAAYALFMDPNTQKLETTFIGYMATEAEELSKELEIESNATLASANARKMTMLWIIIVVVIAGIGTNIMISFSMTRPIVSMLRGVKLFSEGDLTKDVDYYGRDEIAQMGEALVVLRKSLSQAIGASTDAGRDLMTAASDFASLSEQTNASVEEFRASVDELTTNLNDMAQASEEVNNSVREVSAGAHTTAEKGTDIARMVSEAMTVGDDGMHAVQKAVAGIGEVAESSTASASAVMDLGERARQIQSFVAQIGGIADQTNLLALNAAIEAARAGEAGRGFAVVAEEVRKLAEDSNVAAKSIADLANTITSDLETIVESSQSNAKKSADAVELSNSTETAIEKMIDILRGISNATQDLAAISQEQAASSTEIAESIHNMSERIGRSAETGDGLRTGIAEISNAAEDISSRAEKLKNLSDGLEEELSFFTLDRQSASPSGMKALPPRR